MSEAPKPHDTAEIPSKVFEVFLAELEASGASSEVIARLRETIFGDKAPTEKSIRAAIFGTN